jgi:tRNA(Arg) A34 adenosine deaminase TadA
MKTWIAKIAIETAKTSSYPVFRHGVVITSGGRIIFKSTNKKKSVTPSASMSVHAEVSGLKAVMSKSRLKRRTKTTLYVCRVNTKDSVVLSHPCEKCMEIIRKSGIVDSIYYSTNEGTWRKILV